MITALKPYPAMKPSGAEWLGQVPLQWDMRRFWEIADTRTEKNRPELGLLSVFLGRGVIPYGQGSGQVHKPSLDLSGYQTVYPGDLVLNNQQAWRGSLGVSGHHGIISPAYLVFSLSGSITPQFADYLFQSRVMVAQFVTASKGVGDIQRDVHMPWLKNTRVPVPPLQEQAAIVRYLDHVDRRISRYIRAKERLIELLEEQKQVIVHQAVTRGLDPDVPLKPSGVEWLGDVPEHWEVRPLGVIGSFFKGGGGTKDDEVDGGIPCVRYGDLYTQHQRFIRETRTGISAGSAPRYTSISYGDVLFAGSGETLEEIGKSAVNLIDGPAYCGGDVIVFRPSIEVDATFLGYAADCPTSIYQKACMGRGVTIMHIYSQELRHLLLPFPPPDEQRAITRHLDHETAVIDAAIDRASREIDLLREYRTRLIADVVTGKLDVRKAASDLPEVDAGDLEDIIEIDDAVADELDAELEEVAT